MISTNTVDNIGILLLVIWQIFGRWLWTLIISYLVFLCLGKTEVKWCIKGVNWRPAILIISYMLNKDLLFFFSSLILLMFTIWKALETVLWSFKAAQRSENSSITFSAVKQKGDGTFLLVLHLLEWSYNIAQILGPGDLAVTFSFGSVDLNIWILLLRIRSTNGSWDGFFLNASIGVSFLTSSVCG